MQNNIRFLHRSNGSIVNAKAGDAQPECLQSSFETRSAISDLLNASEESIFSGPIQLATSSGFAWAKRRKDEYSLKRSHSRSSSRCQISALDSSSIVLENNEVGLNGKPDTIHEVEKPRIEIDRADCFDVTELYRSPELIIGRLDAKGPNNNLVRLLISLCVCVSIACVYLSFADVNSYFSKFCRKKSIHEFNSSL